MELAVDFVCNVALALALVGVWFFFLHAFCAGLRRCRRVGETRGFQFLHLFHREHCGALAFGLEPLDTHKRLGIHLQRVAKLVDTAHGDAETREWRIREAHQLVFGVLAHEVLPAGSGLQKEPFHVEESVLVLVEEHCCPYLVGLETWDEASIEAAFTRVAETLSGWNFSMRIISSSKWLLRSMVLR